MQDNSGRMIVSNEQREKIERNKVHFKSWANSGDREILYVNFITGTLIKKEKIENEE